MVATNLEASAMIGGSAVEAQTSAYDAIDQWRDGVDVARVHEDDATVDVETGETEFLGQADVEDGQIAVEVGLFVDDQIEMAVLERRQSLRRQFRADHRKSCGALLLAMDHARRT